MGVAHPLGNLAGQEIVHRHVGRKSHGAVQQRKVDVLPLAADVPVLQRRQNCGRCIHAGDQVADRDARLHRATARFAVRDTGQAHQAAHALKNVVISRQIGKRAVLAKTSDRAIDEPWIDLLQILPGKSVTRERTDLVVLDHHIGYCRKLAHNILPFRRGDVEGDRLLRTIHRQEVGRVIRFAALGVFQERRPPGARVVPFVRPFDLDHFGAKIGKILRGPWPGKDSGQVQNADVPKCCVHRFMTLVSGLGQQTLPS